MSAQTWTYCDIWEYVDLSCLVGQKGQVMTNYAGRQIRALRALPIRT